METCWVTFYVRSLGTEALKQTHKMSPVTFFRWREEKKSLTRDFFNENFSQSCHERKNLKTFSPRYEKAFLKWKGKLIYNCFNLLTNI